MTPCNEKNLKGWDRRRRIRIWEKRLDAIAEWEGELEEGDPTIGQVRLLGAEARARLQLLEPTDGLKGDTVEDILEKEVETAQKKVEESP